MRSYRQTNPLQNQEVIMQEGRFVLKSPFKPQGDQPQAIEALAQGVQSGMPCQVLLGVTGSAAKPTPMASVIERVQRPTLVHRAQQDAGRPAVRRVPRVFPGQRGGVFRLLLRLLPAGGVHCLQTDTYIEKDAAINEEIERLRHSATGGAARAAGCDHRRLASRASTRMGDPIEYEGHDDLPASRHGR